MTIKDIANVVRSYLPLGNTNYGGQAFVGFGHQSNITNRSDYQLMHEYRNLVYACVQAISQDVSRYEPIFNRMGKDGKLTPLATHPFKTLLDNPNKYTSKSDLFETLQAFMELTGNAYLYMPKGEITQRPRELWNVRPDRMHVVVDEETGLVKGYIYRDEKGTEIPFELDEIIHFKTFNPFNPYKGMGTVEAALLYIDTENSTSKFQNSFMHNQATPSGVLSIKGNVTPEAFNKVKKVWAEQQAGLVNAGKTLFIRQADVTFEKLGLSIADLELPSLKGQTQEDVMMMFRLPKQILGNTSAVGVSGLGRNNLEAIEYIYAKRTIEPKLDRIDDTLTLTARNVFKDDSITVTHVSQIPEDKEFVLKEKEAAVDKWVMRNEIRRSEGREDVEGGDSLFSTFNQTPIDQLVPTPAAKAITVKLIRKVAKNSQTGYFDILEKIEDKATGHYVKELAGLLGVQEMRVKRYMNQYYDKAKQVVNFNTDTFSFEFDQEELMVVLRRLFAAMEMAGSESLIFTEAPDKEFILNQAQREAVFAATDRLMQSFNKETAQKIQKAIAAGLAENESLEQLTARIESIYVEAKGYRAERIARTEAHKAVNASVAEGYRQAGYAEMQWYASPPSCEYCLAMNGKVTTIGAPFIAKGETIAGAEGGSFVADYTDVEYADLHPNCDCKLLPKKP
jgi:HK97 family phage portal protein